MIWGKLAEVGKWANGIFFGWGEVSRRAAEGFKVWAPTKYEKLG
jgi:hypothetical protein